MGKDKCKKTRSDDGQKNQPDFYHQKRNDDDHKLNDWRHHQDNRRFSSHDHFGRNANRQRQQKTVICPPSHSRYSEQSNFRQTQYPPHRNRNNPGQHVDIYGNTTQAQSSDCSDNSFSYSGPPPNMGAYMTRYSPYCQNEDYFEDEDPIDDVELSKEIVRIVRHGKYRLIKMDSEGYVNVHHILRDRKFIHTCGYISFDRIWNIVETNDKKRFELKNVGAEWFIKATQGHTVQVENLNLTPITNPQEYPSIFHGTYFEAWEFIKEEGLNRMKRNHIHFAIGFPNDRRVVSGMRKSSELVIVLNLEKAMLAGLKFFLSSNGVVLTAGDESGRIHPKYFSRVIQLKPYQKDLPFEVPPDLEPTPGSSKDSENLSVSSSYEDRAGRANKNSDGYRKTKTNQKDHKFMNRPTAHLATNDGPKKRKITTEDDRRSSFPHKFRKYGP